MNISCNGANFVAQQLQYQMTQGWMEGDGAANEWYKPLDTFKERFSRLADHILSLGYTSMDLWTAQLNWRWASHAHILQAKEILSQRNMSVSSYAGHFGDNTREFESACLLITQLNASILGGFTGLLQSNSGKMLEILEKYECRFAFENHPEKDSAEILTPIKSLPPDRVGLCLDTGWLGIHDLQMMDNLEVLFPRVMHIHLKDLLNQEGHNTCAVGKGILPLQEVYCYLKEHNYQGGISIEHEPEDRDPSTELVESLKIVQRWEDVL